MGKNGRPTIAILGGGPAGIAAAFELTREPDWNSRDDVTVYQMGWRLGGKCASGRNCDDNSFRIEEHGLHVLGGCYDVTFRMLRECYEEWSPPPGSHKWTMGEAFKEHDDVTLQEFVNGKFEPWNIEFPRKGGRPGDIIHPPTVWGLLRALLSFLDLNHYRIVELSPAVGGKPRNLPENAKKISGAFGLFINKALARYPAPENFAQTDTDGEDDTDVFPDNIW